MILPEPEPPKTDLIIEARILEVIGDSYEIKPIDGGFSGAGKFIATSKEGQPPLFVKYGATDATLTSPNKYRDWLNQEIDVMAALGEQSFMPKVIKAHKEEEYSVLAIDQIPWPNKVIEWTLENVQKVVAVTRQLKDLRLTDKPQIDLPDAGNQNPWVDVFEQLKQGANPTPYASREWLLEIAERLLVFNPKELLVPKDLCHGDLRSDNIRIMEGEPTILVDWTFAGMGNHDLDIAYWLPSVKMEGGPNPWEVLPGRPDLAMMVAGYFFARAMLPEIPDAPMVRTMQRKQLMAALPWLAHELGVPLPETVTV